MQKHFQDSVFKQALVALSFDLGGILSGGILLVFTALFETNIWILALFPPILTIRGNIGGIFSGKLGTMLHTGEIKPRLLNNTLEFYSLVKVICFLTFVDTIGIGVLSFIINFAMGSIFLEHLIFFLTVPMLTCLLAIMLTVPVTAFIGITVFKRGFDPDIIVYPAMSTIDDIVVTACYALVVSLAILSSNILWMVAIPIALGVIFAIVLINSRKESVFKKTLKEGAPVILLTSLFGAFGGVGLASIKNEIKRVPSILLIYPSLIDILGDVGAILGSMGTTKLALGYISSFKKTIKESTSDLLAVEGAAAIMHIVFGLIAFLLGVASGFKPDLVKIVAISLTSNLMGFILIFLFSILLAVRTFRYGLDPDNFVIPAVSSVSDVTATLTLIIATAIIGV
ncbi:MAG: magnesium transporter [Nitrososphaeria archaeon]